MRELRIAFVGTCQVTGMAAAAQRMLPAAQVLPFLASPPDAAAIRDSIVGFDLVVTQAREADGEILSAEALTPHVRAALFVPPAVFTGFHPDATYVSGPDGAVAAGYGPYHSQIAIAAFMLGLDADRAVALFNAHVFHRLGYFDAYAIARDQLAAIFQRDGYPLMPTLNEFRRRRVVFMHTINHPTIELSWRMAALTLARAGLADRSAPFQLDLRDDLTDSIVMPVLPAIARRIGVTGGDAMLRTVPESAGSSRTLPMRDFVRASFDTYRDTDPAVFAMPAQVGMADRLRAVLA